MKTFLTGAFAALTLIGCATVSDNSTRDTAWTPLLDKDLSGWEVWIGVPHSSVKGLPEGTYQSDNVHKGTPIGLVDQKDQDIFTTIEEDGETVLKIKGEIYAGLTTLESFENYHLKAQIKWGETKWAPRLEVKRDSGILYHCEGEHARFWKVWMACLEFQVQEKDFGDFIPLGGVKAAFKVKQDGKRRVFDPTASQYTFDGGYIHAEKEPDLPNGQWNDVDIYVLGDKAIHVVNGEVVFAIKQATSSNGQPLTRGQLQIQSEAADIFYKDVKIRPITALPEALVLEAGLD